MKIYHHQVKMDCGPTCLRMMAAHYGRKFSLQKLRNLAEFSREWFFLLGIYDEKKYQSRGAKNTLMN